MKLELENEELRATEDALKHQRDRYRGLFEQCPAALLLVDLDGRFRTVNQRARRLLDLPSEVENFHLNTFVAEEDREEFHEFIQQFQLGTQQAKQRFRFRNRQDYRWQGIASVRRFTDREGEKVLYVALLPVTES